MPPESEDPSSTTARPQVKGGGGHVRIPLLKRLFSVLKATLKANSSADSSLREVVEEYMDDKKEEPGAENFSEHEKLLLSNILKLGALTAEEVMIPRADIRAIEVDISKKDLLDFFADTQVSRVPVYQEKLDDVLGTIHIKDVLKSLANENALDIRMLVRDVPVISPAMPVLDLLLTMRQNRRHMALVVDEYGGVDGLVTIGDIIETIVGEIDDEHDTEDAPEIIEVSEDTFIADARVDIEEFEDQFGKVLSVEEREENDTLGGLVSHMAGRVPARGEILTHDTGMIFEVLEADPRRISRLRIRRAALAAE